MKWSKLKEKTEDNFADCINGRVKIYATRYTSGSHFMARGWITIDGEQVANFSTPDNQARFGNSYAEISNRIPEEERTPGNAVEKGEFSRYDLFDACWEYLSINIETALNSDNPIIRSFAILDKRTGKRRLSKINKDNLHPLAQRMLELRLSCEKPAKQQH